MGTIVNAISVIVGGMIGLLIRRGLPKKVEETAMKLLGLAVFLVSRWAPTAGCPPTGRSC